MLISASLRYLPWQRPLPRCVMIYCYIISVERKTIMLDVHYEMQDLK
jgi:hypothetical protein